MPGNEMSQTRMVSILSIYFKYWWIIWAPFTIQNKFICLSLTTNFGLKFALRIYSMKISVFKHLNHRTMLKSTTLEEINLIFCWLATLSFFAYFKPNFNHFRHTCIQNTLIFDYNSFHLVTLSLVSFVPLQSNAPLLDYLPQYWSQYLF